MSRARLVVVVLFLGGAAATAFLAFTDSALTELRVVWPGPLVVGLIALVTARKAPARAPVAVSDWKGADPAALHALGLSHRFTPAQLEENRVGRLHPEQQSEGVAAGTVDVRFGGVMLTLGQLLLLAGLALPFFPRALKDFDFHFAWPEKLGVALFVGAFIGGVLGSVPLTLGLVAFRHGRRVIAAYRQGRVESVTGALQKLEVRRRRSGSSLFYVVGELRLSVGSAAWHAMKGGQFRVYYVPGVLRVLSLEPA